MNDSDAQGMAPALDEESEIESAAQAEPQISDDEILAIDQTLAAEEAQLREMAAELAAKKTANATLAIQARQRSLTSGAIAMAEKGWASAKIGSRFTVLMAKGENGWAAQVQIGADGMGGRPRLVSSNVGNANVQRQMGARVRPPVGSVIQKEYNGASIEVLVTQTGYEYLGDTYSSLSALAKVVSGQKSVNGWAWFGLA